MKKPERNSFCRYLTRAWLVLFTLFTFQSLHAISIKDSTVAGKPVYVIDWIDNKGKPRKVAMVKDTHPASTGVCVFIRYYDGNTPVNITSPLPNDDVTLDKPWNVGFGSTVHHDYTDADYHVGGTLTISYQGPHHIIFTWVQTVNGATETVNYTFMDGNDYFQWQNTVDARTGTITADSRGPYCTMNWDGISDFSPVTGQEYAAEKYFVQNSYNGAWTLSGDATNDIPFVRQWDNSKEVGYVQTQTFNQQLAGAPNWGGSWNCAASGSSIEDATSWAFDYQMNFYDKAKKITWGMPYGYMNNGGGDGVNNGGSTGNKNGWGQYSLSIIFDTEADNGVRRVRDENRLIHNGSVSLTAVKGSIVTTGPVGSANPATQTLSPAGYDHNYRTWWTQANASEESEFTMNVASGTLKNPTFRVKGMTQLPASVKYNGSTLVAGTDYYASYNSSTNEAWVTILRNVSGSNTIVIAGNNSGITISSATVTPSTVTNTSSNNLAFAVTATDDGSVASVTLDLTSIGGGAAVAMTSAGGNNYTYNYNLAAGTSTGTKTITVTVTDNLGNTDTQTITLTVNSGITISSATVTPSTVMNNVSNNLAFAVTATDDGSVASVELDLSSIGGGASVAMTAAGGNNYTHNFVMASGVSTGTKTIVVTVTDNSGNTSTQNISLTVNAAIEYLDIYTDPSTMVTATWNQNGTLAEQTGMGASEGTKDYNFTFTAGGWYAGFGLNFSNWDDANAKDFSTYDNIEISYYGPLTSGDGFALTLALPGNTQSTVKTLPATTGYTTVQFPLSDFGAIDFSQIVGMNFAITGTETGSGTLRIDNIRISRPAATPTPEMNVKVGATSIASAGSYDFGGVVSGTSGSAVTFTIENTGTGALSLTGTPKVAISGTDQSMFTIVQTSTASSVAASGSTTFTITFSPTSTGAKTALISIANDDADENPYVINLTGTGTSPEMNVKVGSTSIASSGSYNFGNVLSGTSGTAVTFTVENTGNAGLNLTGTPKVAISGTDQSMFTIVQTSTAASIAASGSTTFTITFSPTSGGAKSAQISIANNDSDENPYVINLSGTGTAPEMNVKVGATSIASGGSHDFGSVVSGSSSSVITFTIENTGTGNLSLSGTPKVAKSGTDQSMFTVVQTTTAGTISASGTTTFTITFSPTSSGSKSAQISIANNDSDENPYVINLTGTSTSPEIDVKAGATSIATAGSYDFGSVLSGTSGSSVTFTIENTGNASLSLSGTPKVAISGTNQSEFTINQTSTSATVAAAGSTTFTITFSPTSAGSKSAQISIANNDSNENPYVINLTGTATAPEINLQIAGVSSASGSSYDFGSLVSGTSGSAITFTIQNTGTSALSLSGSSIVSISGTNQSEFSINQSSTSASVAAAGSTTFTITFSPTSVGSKSASISIANDDSNENPYTINLTGTATATPAPEINVQAGGSTSLSGSTYDFGSVLAGSSGSAVTFTVQNVGTGTLTLSGTPKVVISGTDASDFSVVETSLNETIAASGSSTFTITFSPSSAGVKSATITIANDDSDESTYTINLTGTGTATGTAGKLAPGSYSLYPNPVNSTGTISLNGISGKVNVIVRNELGIVVKEVQTEGISSGSSVELDLNNQLPGIYFVEISTTQGTGIQKVIKE